MVFVLSSLFVVVIILHFRNWFFPLPATNLALKGFLLKGVNRAVWGKYVFTPHSVNAARFHQVSSNGFGFCLLGGRLGYASSGRTSRQDGFLYRDRSRRGLSLRRLQPTILSSCADVPPVKPESFSAAMIALADTIGSPFLQSPTFTRWWNAPKTCPCLPMRRWPPSCATATAASIWKVSRPTRRMTKLPAETGTSLSVHPTIAPSTASRLKPLRSRTMR